jgi:hypothetical protein
MGHLLATDGRQDMNNKISAIQVKLPGEWSDGWLYKEHLILWSRTGQMFVAELAELERKVRLALPPELAVAVGYAIFRNDWKSSEQFKALSTLPRIYQVLLEDSYGSEDPIIVNIDSLDITPAESESVPGFVLDTNLYANCIFVGSTEGLFESRFDPGSPRRREPVVQRLDYECATVNAKYSAVNVSAGDRGLLFSRVDVDERSWSRDSLGFKRTAELSFDNSFASYNVLNYGDQPFPTFLRAQTRDSSESERSERQENRVVGYDDQADISGLAAAVLAGRLRAKLSETRSLTPRREDLDTAQVLGNSAGRLLVKWEDALQVVDISARRGKEITARADSQYRSLGEITTPPSAILKTYAINSGFLVELFDEVRLLTPRGSYMLARERAARVRTFVHARRYQDVALVVGESDVRIIGFMEYEDEAEHM